MSGKLPKANALSEIWDHWVEKCFHTVSEGLMESDVCGKKFGGGGSSDGLASLTIQEFFQLPSFSQDIFSRG